MKYKEIKHISNISNTGARKVQLILNSNVSIPYLTSWPIEEHHNIVKDHDKPVKRKENKYNQTQLIRKYA